MNIVSSVILAFLCTLCYNTAVAGGSVRSMRQGVYENKKIQIPPDRHSGRKFRYSHLCRRGVAVHTRGRAQR